MSNLLNWLDDLDIAEPHEGESALQDGEIRLWPGIMQLFPARALETPGGLLGGTPRVEIQRHAVAYELVLGDTVIVVDRSPDGDGIPGAVTISERHAPQD